DELGRRTGGRGAVTLQPAALPALFAEVYAGLLGSRLEQGEVKGRTEITVFPGAETLDLVVVGKSERTETLSDPDGRTIAIDNRSPDRVYYAGSEQYRFFKIRDPQPGRWSLSADSPASRGFAALQHFDLQLTFVDPPQAVELGQTLSLRGRLATTDGTVPSAEFLDRHVLTAESRAGAGDDADRPGQAEVLPMARGDDGNYHARFTPKSLGEYALSLRLSPRADGVLSRATDTLARVAVIPPVHLTAAPVAVGPLKQGDTATATLDLSACKVGVTLDLALALTGDDDSASSTLALQLAETQVRIAPAGLSASTDTGDGRHFTLSLSATDDALPGPTTLTLTVTPTAPSGFADRAIAIPVRAEIVALTFWERYGRLIQYSAGTVLALFLLLGIVTPARFKKRSILYYMDVRDPDLPRRSSYPLGTRVKRGFYRAARVALGPSGPVKRGGVVALRAHSGGAVIARPLGGNATVYRTAIPSDDSDSFDDGFGDDADDSRTEVPLKDGCFRAAAGVAYQIGGSGFLFWHR
ncbi:MAG: hypothetical protein AAGC55_18550, partial [Myxococcota bacterium]